jgi:hypothetical protein
MKTCTIRPIDLSDVTFTIIAEDETFSAHESLSECMSYDEIEDLMYEASRENVWKWCRVEVKGTYKGLEASEYLGACSYESEEDFKKDGYYEDMCKAVLADLQSQLNDILSDLTL